MNYMFSIKTSIMYFPVIACLFTIPYILKQYHKYGSINKLRTLIVYSFILYMMTIYFLVILALPDINDVINNKFEYNLIPFSFINDITKETSFNIAVPSTYLKALTEHCIYVVIFNILMTVPFGMYLRYYYKFSLKKVLILSFFLSLFFELTQLTGLYFIYPKPYRLFDVDDLILNTTGGVLGYLLFGIIISIVIGVSIVGQQIIDYNMGAGKIKKATKYYGLTKENALKEINKINKQRSKHYNYYTSKNWKDYSNYDYVINVG